MENKDLKALENVENAVQLSYIKASKKLVPLLILSIVAGAFIGLAAHGSNMISYNLLLSADAIGLGKALSGLIFTTGLILVVIAGGELFTGNSLMYMGVLRKKITLTKMLRNWSIVYLGNAIGALLIVFLIYYSGLLQTKDLMLGTFIVKTALYKVNFTFFEAVILGLLCNWLVSLAVWMALKAKSVSSKIIAMFFPIWLFVASGFEHSIANIFYVPLGVLLKSNSSIVTNLLELGISSEKLSHLTISSFLQNNLLPVTLGNVLGGVVFVALVYHLTTGKSTTKSTTKTDKN